MADVDIRLNHAAINHLLRSPTGPVSDDIRDRGRRIEAAQKRLCPVRTGRLRASIHADYRMGPDGLEVEVGASAPYALFVEFPTGDPGPTDAQPFIRPSLLAGR